MKMNTDPVWLHRMAVAEDNCPVTVGGLIYENEMQNAFADSGEGTHSNPLKTELGRDFENVQPKNSFSKNI